MLNKVDVKVLLLVAFAVFILSPVFSQDEVDVELRPVVVMDTSIGKLVFELNGEDAPIATLNFLSYVEDGFYNNTIIHKVKKDFIAHGGVFDVELKRKKGLKEPIVNEWRASKDHKAGTLAMFREATESDSAQAEFFINLVDNKQLGEARDGAAYVVFGKLVGNADVLKKLNATPVVKNTKVDAERAVVPKVSLVIKSVTVKRRINKAKAEKLAVISGETAKMQSQFDGMSDEEIIEKVAELKSKEFGVEVHKSDSGLRYLVLRKGTGTKKPMKVDTVSVHYRGALLDGTEFDNSYKRNDPLDIELGKLIPGFIEGVKGMVVGEKRLLIIPGYLGYGVQGSPGGGIPPNATLQFEIELLKFE